jgi:hypothetical protein
MKAKLIKTFEGYELHILNNKNNLFMPSAYIPKKASCRVYYLSEQNCDEIFRVFDVNSEVEAIVKTICPDDRGKDVIYGTGMAVGIQCFNKAMELNKDKVFTLEDIEEAFAYGQLNQVHNQKYFSGSKTYIQSLQQPTEIEVMIVMEDSIGIGDKYTPELKPLLDENGCLILKRKI